MESKLHLAKEDQYKFGKWTINTVTSHIMGSKCETPSECQSNEDSSSKKICNVCLYENELKLPSLPDMVYAKNKLIIEHENGGKLEFNALDALKQVGDSPHHIEVAHAKVWQEARSDCEFSKRIVKDYDWTYSTSYTGTLQNSLVSSQETEERIDLEKLRVQEEILFYKEIFLYEDELDDNGCTCCTVKVRVMPSGFFVVFRHYLRVDHVLIRVYDTRLYHEKGMEGILQETSTRQCQMDNLKVDVATYKNPDLVWQHLPVVKENIYKILPREDT